jgi:hypothetical protein
MAEIHCVPIKVDRLDPPYTCYICLNNMKDPGVLITNEDEKEIFSYYAICRKCFRNSKKVPISSSN